MKEQSFENISVAGIKVRTKNADELDPSTAKIAQLWETFYTHAVTKLGENANVYGVYTNYESDHNGEFDVYAASNSIDITNLKNAASTEIQAGKYLTFTGKGAMPQAIISLWGEVWGYFTSNDCPHERAYTTDFECYLTDVDVMIAIAIK